MVASAMTRESTVAPGDADRDEVWEAGFEMGRLSAQIAARPVRRKVGLTIREANRESARELARRHGYELHLRDGAEVGFCWAEFWPCR